MCGQGEDLSQVQKGDIAIQGAIYNSQTQQVQFLGCPESVLKGCSGLQAVSGMLRVQVKSLGREKSLELKFLARLICLCIVLWATFSSSATNVSTLPPRKMSTRDRGIKTAAGLLNSRIRFLAKVFLGVARCFK